MLEVKNVYAERWCNQLGASLLNKVVPLMSDYYGDLAYDLDTIKDMVIGDNLYIFVRATGTTLFRHKCSNIDLEVFTVPQMISAASSVTWVAVVSIERFEAEYALTEYKV